ncbi:MAG: sugar phosphate nucleotidyltransferase [Parvularculaceae bacterium]
MKGIVLAGGSGTRLHPVTRGVSKQMLPIYDKPMIYYPLSVLMFAGIREIISSRRLKIRRRSSLLGDGSDLGVKFIYAVQPRRRPRTGASSARNSSRATNARFVLGDNVFGRPCDMLANAAKLKSGAEIFGYQVADPERYGVIEFGEGGKVLSIEEKPVKPKSKFATDFSLYFYDETVCEREEGEAFRTRA